MLTHTHSLTLIQFSFRCSLSLSVFQWLVFDISRLCMRAASSPIFVSFLLFVVSLVVVVVADIYFIYFSHSHFQLLLLWLLLLPLQMFFSFYVKLFTTVCWQIEKWLLLVFVPADTMNLSRFVVDVDVVVDVSRTHRRCFRLHAFSLFDDN